MSGIVLRQTLGSTSPSTWLSSPDLMPFCAPVADTSFLTALYGTAFAQPPLSAQANQVYVRGKNSGTGAASATVSLYWVEHSTGSSDPILTPKNWTSTGFTVGGNAGNAVSVQAANAGDVVLAASALTWTPTALQSQFGHYVLIAWVDGGGTPPPDFSTMPKFANLQAVGTYVASQPSLVMLDTSYSGMFARQYQDQTPVTSAPDATWTNSPDLIAYTGQAAYDPTLLKRTFDWSTHQPPVAGQGSNLYLRGVDTSAKGTSARVSFFYAVNNPGASPNPLLDPTTWKSDGMTVGGTTQNYVDIKSLAGGDLMVNDTPLVWTPAAAPPAGATYALIAWVDNWGGNNPPPFASLTKFSSQAALNSFLAGVGTMVLWDGTYDGLFVRQFSGQTASQPGTGAQTSPDIISTGVNPAPNAALFTDPGQYDSGAVSAAVSSGVPNFIYLRVKNPNNGARRARVYLYAGDTATPALGGLQTGGFTVAGAPQNWVDLEADAANEILVSTVPVVWVPPVPQPGSIQPFLLTYVDGSDDPQPPDFSVVGYGQLSAVQLFVGTQPQLSWVAVTVTAPSSAPTFAKQFAFTPPSAGSYYLGVQLQNMPSDGTFTVGAPGPDSANTLVMPSFHAPSPNAAVVWKVAFPAGFASSLVLSYWQGQTVPSNAGATLVLVPAP